MIPFADNLGLVPSEFVGLESIFRSKQSKIILVEGETDLQYFEHIRHTYPKICGLSTDVEFVPYGGKDTLKNTHMLKFIVSRFEKVYITFDLDADSEVRPFLEKIGLEKKRDFLAVGLPKRGLNCVEGLLPADLRSRVYAREHEVIDQITSGDQKARNSARAKLKGILLDEFKKSKLNDRELLEFSKVFRNFSDHV